MTTTILIIIATLLLSAFFSGMEIAYVSSNRIHMEIEKTQENFISRILDKMTRHPSKFITTMLLGNNIALVIYGLFMGDFLLKLFLPYSSDNTFLNYWITGTGSVITQTIISTLVILFTAEFLPKVFFQIYANSFLKFFAVPAYFFYLLFSLLSSMIMKLSDSLLKLFFKTEGDVVQEAFTKVELGNYIDERMETVEDDVEVDSEVLIFKNALEFPEIKAREVMVPRPEIIAVEADETIGGIRENFISSGLSKILVYRKSIDDIIGYVHSFELFKKPESLNSIIRPVIYVPETMLAKDLLNVLMKKRKSMAVVLDEYGGTSGIATVEDIVEELFGEIEDEHDSVVLVEEELGEGRFKFSARLEIDYLNETYKLELPKNENYETLSGLIVDYTEDIPEKGGVIEIENYQMTILEVSNTKIELVEIQSLNTSQN